jgi:hypothetical protein
MDLKEVQICKLDMNYALLAKDEYNQDEKYVHMVQK